MTMEAYAFCPRPIGSIKEWQGAIDASGFDLRFRSAVGIADHRGHLPALWRGREAGFEFSLFPFEEVAETYEDLDLGGPWPFAYVFYYGTLSGCIGTWFALAACVKLTGGIAFDAEAGRTLTPEEAIAHALDTENEVDRIESEQPGRPSS